MTLTETPEAVSWPPSHYVFVEKTGPFQKAAPAAWTELRTHLPALAKTSNVIGRSSLHKFEPHMVYRAGVMVLDKPQHLPEGLAYHLFAGGTYACFTLKGSYAQLPDAWGRVFGIIKATGLHLRDDFFVETYLNDPATTPEAELLTQIMMPLA